MPTNSRPQPWGIDFKATLATPKNSVTHPLNISWIVPHEYLPLLTTTPLPSGTDLFDLYTEPENFRSESMLDAVRSHQRRLIAAKPLRFIGNLALSSCPGKKVRLNGPVRGRAAINRDLDLDFERLRSYGITTVICCLYDEELEFLGAPWPKYSAMATRHQIEVIRIPMIEGSTPNSLEEIDRVVNTITLKVARGENVLAHCRGGVGRAGLVACCWLIKQGYCLDAERSIRFARMRRSPKTIETIQQAEFVNQYCKYVAWVREQQRNMKWEGLPSPAGLGAALQMQMQ